MGREQWGRRWAADSGALGPAFTPGRYCTQGKCVHKGPYGSLLHEAFGQGGGRGAEKLPEGTLLEGTGPTPLRQQAGCLRGRMGSFSFGWTPMMLGTRRASFATTCSSACPHLLLCPCRQGKLESQQAFLDRSL